MKNLWHKIFGYHITIGSATTFIIGLIIASLSTVWLPYSYIDGKWPILIGIFIASVGFINNDANRDKSLIDTNKEVHTIYNILDRWWMLLLAIVFPTNIWITKIVLLFNVFSFYWLVFPLTLNFKRFGKEDIFYISTTRDYPILEKIFKKNVILVWLTKLVVYILFVVAYFKINSIINFFS